MKRKILFGCLCCTLLSAACERLDNDRTLHVQEDDSPFTLEDVAKLLSCVPLGNAQMEEVRDAVSSSSDNGYDTEYTMRDLFETPCPPPTSRSTGPSRNPPDPPDSRSSPSTRATIPSGMSAGSGRTTGRWKKSSSTRKRPGAARSGW